MNSLLSAIGLALDLEGAIVLVIGLFRPIRPLFPGWSSPPDDAARDAAFGVAGASLLAIGFVLQSLTYFGVTVVSCSARATAGWEALTLLGGLVYGLTVYEITHRRVFDRQRAYGPRKWQMDYPLDRRRGLWFWRTSDD